MIPQEILKQVRRIEIASRKSVNEMLAGQYHSVFKGRGMEFDEVREYSPGDDIRTIDWNVTARTGRAHVKRYVEERELTVMLLVDASASGEFGTGQRMKGELAVELCALLAFAAIKNNDRVGLIIFTDRIERFLPPRKGRKHVLRVIRELLYFEPTRRGTDIGGALEHLNKIIKRRSVVFLVSDFIGANLRQPLAIANRRHDLIAVAIDDVRERELPPIGVLELEDAETGETVRINSRSRQLREYFAAATAGERAELLGMFKALGIDHLELRTDQAYIKSLLGFFRRRAKRH
jgi:uncharacterized protein (DUF58 family)